MSPKELYLNLFVATLSRLAARDLTPLTENRKSAIRNLANLASDVAQGGVDLHLEAAKQDAEEEAPENCDCPDCQQKESQDGTYYTSEEAFDKIVSDLKGDDLAAAAAKILHKITKERTGKDGQVRIHIVQASE